MPPQFDLLNETSLNAFLPSFVCIFARIVSPPSQLTLYFSFDELNPD